MQALNVLAGLSVSTGLDALTEMHWGNACRRMIEEGKERGSYVIPVHSDRRA